MPSNSLRLSVTFCRLADFSNGWISARTSAAVCGVWSRATQTRLVIRPVGMTWPWTPGPPKGAGIGTGTGVGLGNGLGIGLGGGSSGFGLGAGLGAGILWNRIAMSTTTRMAIKRAMAILRPGTSTQKWYWT